MKNALQHHILRTYTDLRIGTAAIALLFPPSLWLAGTFIPLLRTDFQPSMSAYYHTPLRNIFVGSLFIIGSFLYLYRGFTKRENFLLNVAGLCAVVVALCPTSLTCNGAQDFLCNLRAKEIFTLPIPHGIAAITFFLCIAASCILDSKKTLKLITSTSRQNWLQRLYWLYGFLMIALPLWAAYLSYAIESTVPPTDRHIAYRVEFAAVWIFAFYWITKSLEIYKTGADFEAARGKQI